MFHLVVNTFYYGSQSIHLLQSIQRAHETMVDAKLFWNSGELLRSNINRSPAAYLYNPVDERKL